MYVVTKFTPTGREDMKRKNVSWQKYFIVILLIPFSLVVIRLIAFQAGEEFQVNTYTNADHWDPAVAMDEKGNFVITWATSDFHSFYYNVLARRFNSEGKAIATEFQVNTYINHWQDSPAIAMHKKGNFVITWQSFAQDGSGLGVFAKRFNRKGKAKGKEFQVNTYTHWHQQYPSIAMDEKGNFVIIWLDGGDGSGYGVFAQRFNRKGKAKGKEFQVNTYTASDQQYPSIAMDEKGNFVITWESYGQDGSDWGVFAQRFNSEGEAIGKEFQVNTYTKWYQWHPAIAMDNKGNFVITWSSEEQDGSSYGIFAQRFNKNGEAVGAEFQVNTYTKISQDYPAVAMDNRGNFVIVWESKRQDGSGIGIFAQRFNRKGQPIGTEFQVNTYTKNNQDHPAVAMDEKGNFIVTWVSDDPYGSDRGVFAKMFQK
jgi:hypothetical protein